MKTLNISEFASQKEPFRGTVHDHQISFCSDFEADIGERAGKDPKTDHTSISGPQQHPSFCYCWLELSPGKRLENHNLKMTTILIASKTIVTICGDGC